MTLILGLLFWLLAITVAITVHEFSHALVATRLGDPTPKLLGRLSLNPIKHYDQVGTTMLLITVIMRAFGAPVIPFGWAKPVPFDPYNLANPRRDAALISLAGPVSNLLVAIILALLIRLSTGFPTLAMGVIGLVATPLILLNVVLAIFNLIPIHPLDGGKILVGLLPREWADEVERVLTQYGTLILLFLILPFNRGTSPIASLIGPVVSAVLSFLLP
ncbi:hypothetical protein A3A66_04260 [Microgenomates group bacterium RIFCSPLOWO2_01_FULL_46_13]|nr:MAG: hypothetical protein A2783_00040 [Microgenomates group bacterium RIFCSPHIGHO2_01_FULL_45_11]OGV94193.1 MAG: hypothetical protein A3A66_04260 [Microgenomates group bacterium RIFCSPLOWO2_01_FULL_46_13]